ncbi:MAG: hypothetical protein E6Q97_00795 [Desulfurellales bacterium]|nr:MAG: hypothetical protein E6Q97_00795 [Desulfurellales bacterium]
MALLDMLQNVSNELGLPEVTSVIGSTNRTVRQLLALAQRTVREARTRYEWPKLMRQHTITLQDGVDSYPFPADYDRQVFRTHWNTNRKWELIGPISPQEWGIRTNGIIVTTPRQHFRVKGWANNQFFIAPTPSASDDGQTIVFEYMSTTAIVPRTWVGATYFASGSYCSFDGRIYSVAVGGLSGTTGPLHLSGDGADDESLAGFYLVWHFESNYSGRYQADTDYCLIDEDVIGLGIQYRWLKEKGLDWQERAAEFERALVREKTAETGLQSINLARGRWPRLMGPWNIPDSGYG